MRLQDLQKHRGRVCPGPWAPWSPPRVGGHCGAHAAPPAPGSPDGGMGGPRSGWWATVRVLPVTKCSKGSSARLRRVALGSRSGHDLSGRGTAWPPDRVAVGKSPPRFCDNVPREHWRTPEVAKTQKRQEEGRSCPRARQSAEAVPASPLTSVGLRGSRQWGSSQGWAAQPSPSRHSGPWPRCTCVMMASRPLAPQA